MSVQVKFTPLQVGHTQQLERLARRDGAWRHVPFPALCGVIEHPARGAMLYDTGYAQAFFNATSYYPTKLYRQLLPVTLAPEQQLLVQLKKIGIAADDVKTILISHFHGDHIAGLTDFSQAQFIALKADVDHAAELRQKPWRAVFEGFLPDLLPQDFASRLQLADQGKAYALPKWMAPFTTGFDLFEDGSVIALPLPGHSCGQMGLLLPQTQRGPVFLAADSCWSIEAAMQGALPAAPVALITQNWKKYAHTFHAVGAIARREPDICCMPSHCQTAWNRYHA